VLPLTSACRLAHDHSHRPVLAPATLAALPSTPAIPDRMCSMSRASPRLRAHNGQRPGKDCQADDFRAREVWTVTDAEFDALLPAILDKAFKGEL
jgi:hypothetical protein